MIRRARVDEVIAGGFADPSQLARIREDGYREAGCCIAVGGTFTALPLCLAIAALAAAHALLRRNDGQRMG